MDWGGESHTIEELTEQSFAGVDIALFSAGGSISKHFAPLASDAGCTVLCLLPVALKRRCAGLSMAVVPAISHGAGWRTVMEDSDAGMLGTACYACCSKLQLGKWGSAGCVRLLHHPRTPRSLQRDEGICAYVGLALAGRPDRSWHHPGGPQ